MKTLMKEIKINPEIKISKVIIKNDNDNIIKTLEEGENDNKAK